MTVRRVNRVEVVVVALGQLTAVGSVNVDFVQVERSFSQRTIAEKNFFAVERQVWTPERAVHRFVVDGNVFENVLFDFQRVQTDNEQFAAVNRHVTVAVTSFVSPFVGGVARLSFRIRVGNHQNGIEVNQRVGEHDVSFDFTDFKIQSLEILIGVGVELFLKVVQLSDFVGQVDVVVHVGDAFRRFFSPLDFVGDFASVEGVVRLEGPVVKNLLLRFRT